MKIQTRLYITNTILFSLLFVMMMGGIAFVFYNNSKNSIYKVLKNITYISALFYLEEDEMNFAEFEIIKRQFETEVFNQFYQFYNIQDSIEFGAETPRIDKKFLSTIRETGKLAFEDDNFFCYGIFYEDNQGDFVVITKEKKEILYSQMYSLLFTMTIVLLFAIFIILFINRQIARYAYRPFRTVIRQVNDLQIDSPNLQIPKTNTKDELDALIETFNQLLSQISDTLTVQRNFVRFVSHEFKTPLTAMLGNLEVFLLRERSAKEYQEVAEKLINEVHYLEDTLNTLIFLSDVKSASNESQEYRIDDLVWQVTEKIKTKHKEETLFIHMEIPEGMEDFLSVKINFNQIFLGIYNIIDNGVKYSTNKKIDILFKKQNNKLLLEIIDYGLGIPENQLKNIGQPFFRANNTLNIPGSGIGLALAVRLFEKNEIDFSIESNTGKGTKAKLIF